MTTDYTITVHKSLPLLALAKFLRAHGLELCAQHNGTIAAQPTRGRAAAERKE